MPFLRQLQDSAFSAWVLGSDSVWAYPTILTLHTVGLAILVGAATVVDLRLLGVGRQLPLPTVIRLYRFIWLGFLINLASGLVLFIAEAEDRATQAVFLVKLAFILIAFGVALRLRSDLRGVSGITPRARTMAAVSLSCWIAAIVAGRLMAYL